MWSNLQNLTIYVIFQSKFAKKWKICETGKLCDKRFSNIHIRIQAPEISIL